jgi:hypothetical protein
MKLFVSDYILDTDLRELRRGSKLIAVEPQVFNLLVYLVENGDSVVSKADLIASVWGGRVVSDSTLRRCALRAMASDNAAISSVLTGSSRPLRAWPDRTTSTKSHCRSCAACNPIFHSPGSQIKCRSSRTSSTNTIWKHSAAQPWTSPGLGCVSVIEASPDQS